MEEGEGGRGGRGGGVLVACRGGRPSRSEAGEGAVCWWHAVEVGRVEAEHRVVEEEEEEPAREREACGRAGVCSCGGKRLRPAVVSLADAGVDPRAVVVEAGDALVADGAVPGTCQGRVTDTSRKGPRAADGAVL